jgi:hypothetical protein
VHPKPLLYRRASGIQSDCWSGWTPSECPVVRELVIGAVTGAVEDSIDLILITDRKGQVVEVNRLREFTAYKTETIAHSILDGTMWIYEAWAKISKPLFGGGSNV